MPSKKYSRSVVCTDPARDYMQLSSRPDGTCTTGDLLTHHSSKAHPPTWSSQCPHVVLETLNISLICVYSVCTHVIRPHLHVVAFPSCPSCAEASTLRLSRVGAVSSGQTAKRWTLHKQRCLHRSTCSKHVRLCQAICCCCYTSNSPHAQQQALCLQPLKTLHKPDATQTHLHPEIKAYLQCFELPSGCAAEPGAFKPAHGLGCRSDHPDSKA